MRGYRGLILRFYFDALQAVNLPVFANIQLPVAEEFLCGGLIVFQIISTGSYTILKIVYKNI